MFRKLRPRALATGLLLAAASGTALADFVPVTLNFDDLGASAPGGSPLASYQGLSFDAGSYFVTALSNNFLITTNALTITRTGGGSFYFDSVDYSARGGESREYYFVYDYAAGGTFNGAGLNTADDGNFRTDVGSIHTELSGTSQLITRLSIVGKQTETADYTYLALDNLRVRLEAPQVAAPVPEPETYAMLLAGLGLLGLMAGRSKSARIELPARSPASRP